MSDKPLVSIIIPLYNGSNYVEEAIKSAVAQTYQPIEIIVVNDGSTDDGAGREICDRYADKITYFEKENGGCASALNYGINHAGGEFISWLSHDDLYNPNKIEKQMSLYMTHSLPTDNTIIGCSGGLIDSQGKRIPHPVRSIIGFSPSKEAFSNILLAMCPNGCGLLIPKAVFKKYGYFDETLRFVLDWNLWLKFALKGVDFYFEAEELVSNRVHSMQVTVKQQDLHIKETNKTINQLYEIMKESEVDDTYWKSLYEFSYACSRGDTKLIKDELMRRSLKVAKIKLMSSKAKIAFVRMAKKLYHKLR